VTIQFPENQSHRHIRTNVLGNPEMFSQGVVTSTDAGEWFSARSDAADWEGHDWCDQLLETSGPGERQTGKKTSKRYNEF